MVPPRRARSGCRVTSRPARQSQGIWNVLDHKPRYALRRVLLGQRIAADHGSVLRGRDRHRHPFTDHVGGNVEDDRRRRSAPGVRWPHRAAWRRPATCSASRSPATPLPSCRMARPVGRGARIARARRCRSRRAGRLRAFQYRESAYRRSPRRATAATGRRPW